MRLKLSYFILLIALIFAGPVKLSRKRQKRILILRLAKRMFSSGSGEKDWLNTLLSVHCLMHRERSPILKYVHGMGLLPLHN